MLTLKWLSNSLVATIDHVHNPPGHIFTLTRVTLGNGLSLLLNGYDCMSIVFTDQLCIGARAKGICKGVSEFPETPPECHRLKHMGLIACNRSWSGKFIMFRYTLPLLLFYEP